MANIGTPQGTRDFPAAVVRKRNHIFNIIRKVLEVYGFEPLETPAMENLETLMGKYGEEGDRLIFKILNNGLNDPDKHEKATAAFDKVLAGKNSSDLTSRALKYDLTIPFARYVAQNHHQLTFPFKRYQVQPVWRADKPQKGRYREFTQFDADVVGAASLYSEIELASIYHTVFTRLGLTGYRLMINSRKILAALAEKCGGQEQLTDITIAIDKLDKIGIEKVKAELAAKQLSEDQISIIEQYLLISGNNSEKLAAITELLGDIELGKKGIEEIGTVVKKTEAAHLEVDFTLARGLNYYTGIIYEVKAPATVSIGSIGGGGRYDDLTGLFGVPGIPGVGISFGVDRIYDVLEALELFPANISAGTTALFFNLGAEESEVAFSAMQQLRDQGISAELYHEVAKMGKQFQYAEKKQIAFAVIIGSKEINEQIAVVKQLATGVQETVPLQQLTTFFSNQQVTF